MNPPPPQLGAIDHPTRREEGERAHRERRRVRQDLQAALPASVADHSVLHDERVGPPLEALLVGAGLWTLTRD